MKHILAGLTAALLSSAAYAQTSGDVIVPPAPVDPDNRPVLAFPSIFGAQSAISAPGGTGFVSLTYVNPRGGVSGAGSDGDLAVG